MRRFVLRFIQRSSDLANLLATKIRGVHPKHLCEVAEKPFYLSALFCVESWDRVLDLGSGTGIHAGRCQQVGAETTTIDRGDKADICHNLETAPLPVEDGKYSAVLLLNVLEHIRRHRILLRECLRVLNDGQLTRSGTLYISVPNRNSTWKRRYRDAGLPWMADRDHKREYTRAGIERELEKAGFLIISTDPILYDTPLSGWFALLGAIYLPLYTWSVRLRKRWVRNREEETTGWKIVAVKRNGRD